MHIESSNLEQAISVRICTLRINQYPIKNKKKQTQGFNFQFLRSYAGHRCLLKSLGLLVSSKCSTKHMPNCLLHMIPHACRHAADKYYLVPTHGRFVVPSHDEEINQTKKKKSISYTPYQTRHACICLTPPYKNS